MQPAMKTHRCLKGAKKPRTFILKELFKEEIDF